MLHARTGMLSMLLAVLVAGLAQGMQPPPNDRRCYSPEKGLCCTRATEPDEDGVWWEGCCPQSKCVNNTCQSTVERNKDGSYVHPRLPCWASVIEPACHAGGQKCSQNGQCCSGACDVPSGECKDDCRGYQFSTCKAGEGCGIDVTPGTFYEDQRDTDDRCPLGGGTHIIQDATTDAQACRDWCNTIITVFFKTQSGMCQFRPADRTRGRKRPDCNVFANKDDHTLCRGSFVTCPSSP